MLNEARRRLERGTDVVVGIVETHGRAQTAAQLEGMEIVPRRHVAYRGTTLDEMDVDAVLARRPAQVLVDELAHTNAPGGRNAKRWQDIEELLDAGIDVISTVNVQHLESVNDVVERITGVAQQETVPDAWVRGADQIELVDMSPEALRRRMAHGNVYPAERIDAALANYFRIGNLAALRELALLWMADRVDAELTEYRQRHSIDLPWETKERVVVALTGAPGGDQLVRRAARMAARAKGELVAVHVRRDDAVRTPSSDLLVRHRELVGELGGRYVEASGDDVARALVDVARAENATQLVLGASRRHPLAERLGGSIIARVLRLAGTIDVHVISAPAGEGDLVLPRPSTWGAALPRNRRLLGLGLAVGVPVLTCLALVGFRDDLHLGSVLLLFLLGAVLAAAVGGVVAGLVAAVIAFLLANWYFTQPTGRFTVNEPQNVLALVVFLAVAATVSAYVAISGRRTVEAQRARSETATLVRLLTHDDSQAARLDHLLDVFGVRAASLLAREAHDGHWVAVATAGTDAPVDPTGADVQFEVSVAEGEAVLAVAGSVDAADRGVLAAFAARLGEELDRRRMEASVAEVEALRRGDELRAALLAAVSHDLRTPLAGIKAAVSSLLADDVVWPPEAVRDFCETIDGETDRLTALVENLLDMSRIASGAVRVQHTAVGLDELVPAAIASLGDQVGPGDVEVEVDETLPRVRTDPVLVERVLANLIGNAIAWSPGGEPVHVAAGVVPDGVALRVVDRGPGIPEADRERAFQPFQRLGDGTPGGIGLGLAVARGFADAVDADLAIDDTPGGGTTFTLTLPVAS
jgi:two-component system sensor histidine kinase KdpD